MTQGGVHPEWREVILLALAELGVMRADDARLEDAVHALMEAAGRRPGKPSPGVPPLLAGILADDPKLPRSVAEVLIDTLVPTWWFRRRFGRSSTPGTVREAETLVRERLVRGRFADALRARLERYFGGIPWTRTARRAWPDCPSGDGSRF